MLALKLPRCARRLRIAQIGTRSGVKSRAHSVNLFVWENVTLILYSVTFIWLSHTRCNGGGHDFCHPTSYLERYFVLLRYNNKVTT